MDSFKRKISQRRPLSLAGECPFSLPRTGGTSGTPDDPSTNAHGWGGHRQQV